MVVESLADVKSAFEEWRSRKRHAREAIPTALLERARAAARRHGPAAVARATKVGRGRLSAGRVAARAEPAVKAPPAPTPVERVPSYSRLEIEGPAAPQGPFAEFEMPTGLKVRLFAQTEQALA